MKKNLLTPRCLRRMISGSFTVRIPSSDVDKCRSPLFLEL